jgi:hypothetical protein
MVDGLRELLVLLMSEEIPDEKKPSFESNHPFPDKGRGEKIQLEANNEDKRSSELTGIILPIN